MELHASVLTPGADPEEGGGGGTTMLCCAVGIVHNPQGGLGAYSPGKFFIFRPSEIDFRTF